MKLQCCGKTLFPHTIGMPKAGTRALDFGCPVCGTQYELVTWSKVAYQKRLNEVNALRAEKGLPPEIIRISQTE